MALLDAVARFAEEFNKEQKNFGTIVLRAEERTVPDNLLPNTELRIFYTNTEFDELIIGNAFFLEIASLNQLPHFQEGWGTAANTPVAGDEDNESWKSSWIVFGDRSGDAIFSKLEDIKSPVFGSIQQTDEFQLSSSLESFLDILTKCLIMERDEFSYQAKLEDYTIKPAFIDRTRIIVQEHETAETVDSFINFFFG